MPARLPAPTPPVAPSGASSAAPVRPVAVAAVPVAGADEVVEGSEAPTERFDVDGATSPADRPAPGLTAWGTAAIGMLTAELDRAAAKSSPARRS